MGHRGRAGVPASVSAHYHHEVISDKLVMQVDLKKIKDLQMLHSVLREIEDYSNGNGDADPETIPSTV